MGTQRCAATALGVKGMPSVRAVLAEHPPGRPVIICDVSPPRGTDLSVMEPLAGICADFLCIAYAPGRAVRPDPVMMARTLCDRFGIDVICNLATRDMNKLALQNHLLGAHLLGLENVVVVQGDPLSERDLARFKAVYDFRPTDLIAAIRALNEGRDFRGLALQGGTNFCVGATLDVTRAGEVRLTARKVDAGAEFFLAQPVFDLDRPQRFLRDYHALTGQAPPPIFWGVQVLDRNGVLLGDVPEDRRRELEQGRPGTEIAVEMIATLGRHGIDTIYLIPPILKGGARDYEAAREVVDLVRRSTAG